MAGIRFTMPGQAQPGATSGAAPVQTGASLAKGRARPDGLRPAASGMHLAEFNIGVLRHDWDDPRVADFADNIDRVNGIARRSPGFVWMLGDDEMEAAQTDGEGVLGGNPRTASTLSVWTDAGSLGDFVFNTVHKLFYRRGPEWFEEQTGPRFVMWYVAPGTRPTIEEAKARIDHYGAHGDSDHAFGWSYLNMGAGYRWHPCTEDAA